jgi:amino acid adenylation domain-containing protein
MNEDARARISQLSPEKRALLLEDLKESILDNEKARIERRIHLDGPIPASFSQHRLWVLAQLHPNIRAYNEFSAIQIIGPLDVVTLQNSLNVIVRRHDILRTTFPTIQDEPVQEIASSRSITLQVVDLSKFSASIQEAEIRRIADQESRSIFDLALGPLLRFRLLRLDLEKHFLLVGAHHIIVDGWSVGIFRRELIETYKALKDGRCSPLSELPIQYADFAIWQRGRYLGKGGRDASIEYWVKQLSNLPPLLQLSVAKPRPEIETFSGARQHFKLATRLSKDLKALSRKENVTLFTTLFSGFQILLFRYSRQTDLPIGTAVANRNHRELEDLIGFFVNTLVLRGDLSGNPSVRDLLQRNSSILVAAQDHAEVSFDAVVEAVRLERSLSYHPIIQVVFNLDNTPRTVAKVPGLSFESVELGNVSAEFDLILSMKETVEGLQGYWQYCTDLFDAETIMRMSGHLTTILEGMVEDIDESIATIPILSEKERRQIMLEWNCTDSPIHQEECIHQLFEAQVLRTPAAVSVVHDNTTVSYLELNRRANQLAHRLRSLGIGPGSLVGIYLGRSIRMIVAIFGVLKAGAAYVPLDPSYPRVRLAQIFSEAQLAAIVSEEKQLPTLPSTTTQVICLDTEDETADLRDPMIEVHANNLAYVIYTSGSTGIPKGVPVTHSNLVHSTIARWQYYSEPVTSFLLLSPFAFDSSVAGIFWTLTQGGTLILPSGNNSVDIGEVCRLIFSHRVSHLLAIPSLYAYILEEARERELVSLRNVIVAGEACPARLVQDHQHCLKDALLFNEYGPTEATVWSTVYKCDSASVKGTVPIGRPISNTQIYLLDDHLQLVPVGVPAEIYISGEGVVPGYLNDPETTSRNFVTHAIPGRRLYRTGDLARRLPDGNIELLGRLDQQVKIRGYRIEITEVEAILLSHPQIREAAVIAKQVDGVCRLIGYVSGLHTSTISKEKVDRFIEERLPPYARLSELELVDDFPRLPNGKIDRTRLITPQTSGLVGAPSIPENWTELELTIAKIWKEVLQIDTVDRHHNFFEIGGDSLSVIRVHNRLRPTIGKRLAITDLFKHPTISSLAHYIETEETDD